MTPQAPTKNLRGVAGVAVGVRKLISVDAGLPILWLSVFVVLPIAVLCVVSFWETDLYGLQPAWTARHWRRVFASPVYVVLLLKTIRIATVSTVICLLIGYPVAMVLNDLKARSRQAAVLAFFIPFWVGFVVRTFAWLPILGRRGLINQALLAAGVVAAPVDALLYNEGAVYAGLVSGYLLFMVMPIFLSLERIDPAIKEAAVDLNAGPLSVFRHILLPLSLPGVGSGCVMVFLLTFGAYVTPALLGGSSGIMFSNVVADQFVADSNWAFGSALSLLMTVVVLAGLAVIGRRGGLRRVLLATESNA